MKLKDILTIIVTTSPVKSNPDTTMIKQVLDSFNLIEELQECQKLIVCDGYKQNKDQNRYKKGIIDQIQVDKYIQYIQKLKDLNIINSQIYERDKRYGFAKNLLYCLKLTKTEFVMVVQHDQCFKLTADVKKILQTFQNKSEINYVGFSSCTTQNYTKKLLYNQDFELFSKDIQKLEKEIGVKKFYKEKYQIPLIPLPFWYDKTHISRTKFYIDLFYQHHYQYDNQQYIKIKNFVEDSFGNAYLSQCKNLGLQAQQKVGCFQFYEENDDNIIYHLDGRSYCDEELLNHYIQMKKN